MGIYGHKFDNVIDSNLNNACIYLDNEVNLFVEMNILLEGSLKESFFKVIEKVKEFFRKIKKIFQSLILNFNRLKSAKISKQQNQDLIKVLKVCQPRTLQGTKELIDYYKNIMNSKKDISKEEIKDGDIKRNQGPDEYSMDTSINFEADKTIVDIKESLEAAEKLEEYDRLMKNEYKKEDLELIPLNSIVDDMKDCLKQVESFEKDLDTITNMNKDIDDSNEEVKNISNKMVKFCKEIIRYYNFRIKILNIYFKSAKLSMKAVKSLFGNKIDFTKTSTNINGGKHEVITLKNEIAFRLSDLVDDLQEANKEKDYKRYKELQSKLLSVLHCQEGETVTILGSTPKNDDPDDDWDIEIQHFKNTYEEIPVGGRPLYHHSSESTDLEELKPTAVGNWGQTYYPDPRIYVHLNVILNKAGKKLDKGRIIDIPEFNFDKDGNIDIKYKKQMEYLFENRNVYKIDENIDTVYKDTEMGGTGTFIISEKPIKLKKIDYEQWKKENDFD